MTVRGTVGLAAVFALLAGYLLATRQGPEPAPSHAPHLTLALGPATAVEIAGGDWGTVRLVREADGHWSEPLVPDFLDALASLEVLAVVEEVPADPATYGLGPDAPRLRFLSGPAEIAGIEIGAMNPAETGVYVRRVGERRVLLVGALLRWELEKLRRVVSKTATP